MACEQMRGCLSTPSARPVSSGRLAPRAPRAACSRPGAHSLLDAAAPRPLGTLRSPLLFLTSVGVTGDMRGHCGSSSPSPPTPPEPPCPSPLLRPASHLLGKTLLNANLTCVSPAIVNPSRSPSALSGAAADGGTGAPWPRQEDGQPRPGVRTGAAGGLTAGASHGDTVFEPRFFAPRGCHAGSKGPRPWAPLCEAEWL